jgi:hypothetical protein
MLGTLAQPAAPFTQKRSFGVKGKTKLSGRNRDCLEIIGHWAHNRYQDAVLVLSKTGGILSSETMKDRAFLSGAPLPNRHSEIADVPRPSKWSEQSVKPWILSRSQSGRMGTSVSSELKTERKFFCQKLAIFNAMANKIDWINELPFKFLGFHRDIFKWECLRFIWILVINS